MLRIPLTVIRCTHTHTHGRDMAKEEAEAKAKGALCAHNGTPFCSLIPRSGLGMRLSILVHGKW